LGPPGRLAGRAAPSHVLLPAHGLRGARPIVTETKTAPARRITPGRGLFLLVPPDSQSSSLLRDSTGFSRVRFPGDQARSDLHQGIPRPDRREGQRAAPGAGVPRSEEHTSELQSRENLVCRLLLEKKKKLP